MCVVLIFWGEGEGQNWPGWITVLTVHSFCAVQLTLP